MFNWTSTGAAVVDINSDGWMDVYVSGAMNTNNRKNRLYGIRD